MECSRKKAYHSLLEQKDCAGRLKTAKIDSLDLEEINHKGSGEAVVIFSSRQLPSHELNTLISTAQIVPTRLQQIEPSDKICQQ